jgi:hypothetical protein
MHGWVVVQACRCRCGWVACGNDRMETCACLPCAAQHEDMWPHVLAPLLN